MNRGTKTMNFQKSDKSHLSHAMPEQLKTQCPREKKKKKNSRPAFCHDHEHEHEHDLVNGASPLKIANRKIKITEADMLNWRGNCP